MRTLVLLSVRVGGECEINPEGCVLGVGVKLYVRGPDRCVCVCACGCAWLGRTADTLALVLQKS